MRYIANPVVVDAVQITFVGDEHNGERILSIGDGTNNFVATAPMLARMTPQVGDYVVTQEHGYVYLNPKDVFERKYRLWPEERPTIEQLDAILNSEDSVDVEILPDGSIRPKGGK